MNETSPAPIHRSALSRRTPGWRDRGLPKRLPSLTLASALAAALLAATLPGRLLAVEPNQLLDFCLEHSDRCALSVHSISEGWERHWNADRPQSLASVSKILFLLAYSQAVVDGALDPERRVPREEWGHYLTFDGGAMRASWEALGRPDEIRLDDLVRMMVVHSDNATPDWLLAHLSKGRIRRARRLFDYHDDPLAISAMFGLWFNAGGTGGQGNRIASDYGDFGAAGYRQEASQLLAALGGDATARDTARRSLCVWPPWDSGACIRPVPETTTSHIRRLVRDFFTRSTTRTYATLMRGLLEGTAVPPAIANIAIPHLEGWLALDSDLAKDYRRFGFKPGLLTVNNSSDIVTRAHYVELAATGERYVIVVFLQGLSEIPGTNDDAALNEFIRAFVFDAQFRGRVRDRLPDAEPRPELIVTLKRVVSKGRRVTVRARVENTSPVATGEPILVRLALVDDSRDSEETLAEVEVGSIRGYHGKAITLRGKAGSNPLGRLATVVVDAMQSIEEQSRANNVTWQRLRRQ